MGSATPSTQRRIAESAGRGMRVTAIGILVSALLAAVKIIAGVTGYAYALIADGIESMLDILSALVVVGSLRIAATPPNERFPYGYGKAEPLGAIVVASGLLVAAAVDSGCDAAALLRVALGAAGGRGGGNARLAQGSVPSLDSLEIALNTLQAQLVSAAGNSSR